MRHRSAPLMLLLSVTLLVGLAPDASAKLLRSDPFTGTGPLAKRWRQTDAKWHRVHGRAKVYRKTVDPIGNIGYATLALPKPFGKGLQVTAKMRLSPNRANVGVVMPYADAENHLFCKIEDTPAHPSGYLAIGRRLHGSQPTILVSDTHATVKSDRRYRMVVTRQRRNITCTLSKGPTELGSITYRLKDSDMNAYGKGRRVGIRIRLVSRGTRRDEDDGRSSFEGFMASTI